ncbi:MAG: histidine phosphatase family protein [Kofleriaceae bacterium]|nr:histidine phosphatase family protein [Kofleriaceae bacterium]
MLLRHGDATTTPRGIDATRTLTNHGRGQAHAIGQRLRWYDCGFDQVWVSPLTRARETAAIVLAVHQAPVALHVDERLAPTASSSQIAALLAAWALQPAGLRLIVAHAPTLALLASALVGVTPLEPLARAQALRISNGVLRWRFGHNDDAPTRHR